MREHNNFISLSTKGVQKIGYQTIYKITSRRIFNIMEKGYILQDPKSSLLTLEL
jgi:hypothetical protein